MLSRINSFQWFVGHDRVFPPNLCPSLILWDKAWVQYMEAMKPANPCPYY